MSAITASSGVAAPSQQRCSCRWGGRPFDDLRWSKFKDKHPDEMFAIVDQRVFPFIKNMCGEESTYAHFMKDARLTIPSAGMLQRVVDRLDKVPMDNRDTKGDIYEYLLAKIAAAGQNGQFRTPRHIIELMVHMTPPNRATPSWTRPPVRVASWWARQSTCAPTTPTRSTRAPESSSTTTRCSTDSNIADAEAYSLILADRRSPAASTTRTPRRICSRSRRPRRRSCCSSHCSCACSSRVAARL